MAVVQISRIQVRRGQKNQGTGLPQLASGEFGWAVDTRELYIGNGAVSEGAPAVGNTKVLTQFDNIFDLADTYTYRAEDGYLNTGGQNGTPITRTLQARLDDRVSIRSFGATGRTTQIATSQIQTALDQLYLNDAIKGSAQSRVILNFEPGEYIIDDTIFIPPYATIVGAGSDKTIIRSSTAGKPLFQTVNETSTVGNPAAHASTTTLNQPRNILIKGITLETTVTNKGLVLNSCKDSYFEDLTFRGPWSSGDSITSGDISVEMNNLSSAVETKNNTFSKCKFVGQSYNISSDWDIRNNIWKDCEFYSSGYGIVFGINLGSLDITPGSGKITGPKDNEWKDCYFHDINRQAVWIKYGINNLSQNNTFELVGNAGGPDSAPVYSVCKYEMPGNTSNGDKFSRSKVLGYDINYWDTTPYLPEIEGAIVAVFGETHILNTITRTGSNDDGIIHQKRFRLPAEPDVATQSYEIDYVIASRNYDSVRSGTFVISVNGKTKTLSVSNTYDYTGPIQYEDDISFDAIIQDADGDTLDETIDVRIGSTMPSDDVSQIEYKIRTRKTNIDATGE